VRAAEIVRAAVIGAEIAVGAADVLVAEDVGAVAVDGREAGVDATAVTAAVEAEAGTKLLLPRIFTDSTDQHGSTQEGCTQSAAPSCFRTKADRLSSAIRIESFEKENEDFS